MTSKQEYELGYSAGLADGRVIASPVNTNGHTPEFYRITRERYYDAIYASSEDFYKQGYGAGFDETAREWALLRNREEVRNGKTCFNSRSQ